MVVGSMTFVARGAFLAEITFDRSRLLNENSGIFRANVKGFYFGATESSSIGRMTFVFIAWTWRTVSAGNIMAGGHFQSGADVTNL